MFERVYAWEDVCLRGYVSVSACLCFRRRFHGLGRGTPSASQHCVGQLLLLLLLL